MLFLLNLKKKLFIHLSLAVVVNFGLTLKGFVLKTTKVLKYSCKACSD